MLNYTDGHNYVELPWLNWHLEDISLADEVVRKIPAISIVCLDSSRKINCEDLSTRFKHYFREATCATTRLQNSHVIKYVESASEQATKSVS
jgi:hypothetical protein